MNDLQNGTFPALAQSRITSCQEHSLHICNRTHSILGIGLLLLVLSLVTSVIVLVSNQNVDLATNTLPKRVVAARQITPQVLGVATATSEARSRHMTLKTGDYDFTADTWTVDIGFNYPNRSGSLIRYRIANKNRTERTSVRYSISLQGQYTDSGLLSGETYEYVIFKKTKGRGSEYEKVRIAIPEQPFSDIDVPEDNSQSSDASTPSFNTTPVTSDALLRTQPPASASSSVPTLGPEITGVGGYDQSRVGSDAYTKDVYGGKYLIIYGFFSDSGNKVSIAGTQVSADDITFQSRQQINVRLTNLISTSSVDLVVENNRGKSKPFPLVVRPTSTSLQITAIQGYDAAKTGSDAYTKDVIGGKYAVLYGSFASTGNTVLFNGQSLKITYQSSSQINVDLTGITPGLYFAKVVVGNQASLDYVLNIVGSTQIGTATSTVVGSLRITSSPNTPPTRTVTSGDKSVTLGIFKVIEPTNNESVTISSIAFTGLANSFTAATLDEITANLKAFSNFKLLDSNNGNTFIANATSPDCEVNLTFYSCKVSFNFKYSVPAGSSGTGFILQADVKPGLTKPVTWQFGVANGSVIGVGDKSGKTVTVDYANPSAWPFTIILTSTVGRPAQFTPDLNDDKYVDYADVQIVADVAAGKRDCPANKNCDFSGDGTVSAYDASLFEQDIIKKYDLDQDGKLTKADYELEGAVAVGLMTCPIQTPPLCDYTNSGATSVIDIFDWVYHGKVAGTFPTFNDKLAADRITIQGFDPSTGAYVGSQVTVGKYMILNGNFKASGNTVYVKDSPVSAALIESQSTSQIKVKIDSTIPTGSVTVRVNYSLPTTTTITVVTSTPTTPAPLINTYQGYDAGTQKYTDGKVFSNKFLVLYGTFAGRGDSVYFNDTPQTVSDETPNQINVVVPNVKNVTYTLTVKNNGGTSNSKQITIWPDNPFISGINGVNATTGAYTDKVYAGNYMILYGSFASTGNTVKVGGVVQTNISYQSSAQINVLLASGTATAGTTPVVVENGNGVSLQWDLNILQ